MRQFVLFIFCVNYCFLLLSCGKKSEYGLKMGPAIKDFNSISDKKTEILLQEAIKKNSMDHEAHFQMAKFHFNKKDFLIAQQSIKLAITYGENIASYHLLNAQILLEIDKKNEAFQEIQIAKSLKTKDIEADIILAQCYLNYKQYNNVQNVLINIQNKIPNNGKIYFLKAALSMAGKDTSSILHNLNIAKRLAPNFLPIYQKIVEYYTLKGNIPMAMVSNLQLIKLKANNPEGYINLAKIYQQIEKPDSAIFYYEKAILTKSSLYQASFDAGLLALRTKSYNKAEFFLENTYKYAPKTPYLHTFLGLTAENLGKKIQAKNYYDVAVIRNPKDYRAWQGLKRIEPQRFFVQKIPVDTTNY